MATDTDQDLTGCSRFDKDVCQEEYFLNPRGRTTKGITTAKSFHKMIHTENDKYLNLINPVINNCAISF